jgi:hypothetical protein
MPSNLVKAAVGALAMNGGAENAANKPVVDGHTGPYPDCPAPPRAKYHDPNVCLTKPVGTPQEHPERRVIYERLKHSGTGATLVPNQQTLVCPLQVQNLESPSAIKGFDTTWIVENTATSSVVLSWLVNGVEWSPFAPDTKAMDDPKAILKPGEWTSVPTFESFVYHVREITHTGGPGDVLLQHRAGLIPIGNPTQYNCDATLPDVEPVNPETAARKQEFSRTPTHPTRPCNTIDLGFRNQAGCPLHIYWANQLHEIPAQGFSCGEQFRFHLGTKPASQDFMLDWESTTKFEGTYIGHTFVARLASDPTVVIDSYTLDPTRIVDCPNSNQQVAAASHEQAEAVVGAEGTILPLEEQTADAVAGGRSAVAGTGGLSI